MRRTSPLIAALALLGAIACSDQPVAPETDPADEVVATFAHNGDAFTGTASILCPPGPTPGKEKVLPTGQILQLGRTVLYDFESADSRFNGIGHWYVNKKIEADNSATKIWGKIDLQIEGGLGSWDISFHGYRQARSVVLEAVGQGKGGIVHGQVMKWTMTMTAVPICQRVFQIEGNVK
jgi:hypothetical protein